MAFRMRELVAACLLILPTFAFAQRGGIPTTVEDCTYLQEATLRGESSDSLPFSQACLSIRRQAFGDDDLRTIEAQIINAILEVTIGGDNAGLARIHDVIARQERLYGTDHSSMAFSLQVFASALAFTKAEFPVVEAAHRRRIRVLEKAKGANSNEALDARREMSEHVSDISSQRGEQLRKEYDDILREIGATTLGNTTLERYAQYLVKEAKSREAAVDVYRTLIAVKIDALPASKAAVFDLFKKMHGVWDDSLRLPSSIKAMDQIAREWVAFTLEQYGESHEKMGQALVAQAMHDVSPGSISRLELAYSRLEKQRAGSGRVVADALAGREGHYVRSGAVEKAIALRERELVAIEGSIARTGDNFHGNDKLAKLLELAEVAALAKNVRARDRAVVFANQATLTLRKMQLTVSGQRAAAESFEKSGGFLLTRGRLDAAVILLRDVVRIVRDLPTEDLGKVVPGGLLIALQKLGLRSEAIELAEQRAQGARRAFENATELAGQKPSEDVVTRHRVALLGFLEHAEQLSDVLFRFGEFERAIAIAEEFTRLVSKERIFSLPREMNAHEIHASFAFSDLPRNMQAPMIYASYLSIRKNWADSLAAVGRVDAELKTRRETATMADEMFDSSLPLEEWDEVASVLERERRFDEAGEVRNRLLARAYRKNESREIVRALRGMVKHFASHGDIERALQYQREALAKAESSQDEVARQEANLSLARQLGRSPNKIGEARQLYGEEIAASVRQGRVAYLRSLRAGLGALNLGLGEFDEARIQFELNLAALERANAKASERADTLRSLRLVSNRLNQHEREYHFARRVLDEALADVPMPSLTLASDYATVSQSARLTGRLAIAVSAAERAVAIRELLGRLGGARGAGALQVLGLAYEQVGAFSDAERVLERAVELCRDADACPNGMGDTLNNLSVVSRARGRHAEALTHAERAVAEAEAKVASGRLTRVHPPYLRNRGLALMELQRYEAAEADLRKSVALYSQQDGRQLAGAVNSMLALAHLLVRKGDSRQAVPLLERALQLAGEMNDRVTLARAADGLRQAHEGLGQEAVAIFFGKMAVNSLHAIRGELRAAKEEPAEVTRRSLQRQLRGEEESSPDEGAGRGESLSNGFTERHDAIYRGLVDLLIRLGRLPEAQQVMTMLKEEEYSAFTRRDAKPDPGVTQAGLTGAESAWDGRFKDLSQALVQRGRELEDLKRKSRQGASEEERGRREALEGQMRTARAAFDQFMLDMVRELSRTSSTRAVELGERNLSSLRALQGTLGQLGEGTVMLHYLVGRGKIHIVLTTPSVQVAREAKMDEAGLNGLIKRFRDQLQDPTKDPRTTAKRMYDILLAPVASDLDQAGARTLMVSLDGALRYVPLAALHDGQRFLLEKYALSIYNEAARDKLKDKPKARWEVAGLGLTQKVQGFSALPAVREELESIVNVNGKGILPGTVAFDQGFNRDRMLDALDRAVPVLHIASHFSFSSGTEADSFLVLGDGSRLSLKDIREGDFDFRNVDLLALSACETAVGGGQDSNGREVEGLAALAQKQGAKGVLATLWPVADDSTALLMRQFYEIREAKSGTTKADALRQAQLDLLRGDPKSPYVHPYFWAPFVLMGNWL